jgi:hypothetical protein
MYVAVPWKSLVPLWVTCETLPALANSAELPTASMRTSRSTSKSGVTPPRRPSIACPTWTPSMVSLWALMRVPLIV